MTEKPADEDHTLGWQAGCYWAEFLAEPEELKRFALLSIEAHDDVYTAFAVAADPDSMLQDAVEDWFGHADVSATYLRGYILGVHSVWRRLKERPQ